MAPNENDQSEVTAVRRILHETLAKNAKAHHDIEEAKTDLSALASGINNDLMRKELEAIRERLANIKTLIEPPKSDRPEKPVEPHTGVKTDKSVIEQNHEISLNSPFRRPGDNEA